MTFVIAICSTRMAINEYESGTWHGWKEFRGVKTENSSGQTDTGGNFLWKSGRYVEIISANFPGYIAIPFHYNNNTYIKILSFSGIEPVASTSITGTVIYLDQ